MPETSSSYPGILFWDLAGTLLSLDESTRKIRTLPGCDEALDILHRDFTLLVSTGDLAASARLMLRQAGLLGYFADIYGNLWAPAGKPYREILTEWQVSEEYCLAIGDRVNYDIPADCPRLVTVIINQNSFSLHAGIIVELVQRLQSQGEDFYATFRRLVDKVGPGPGEELDTRAGSPANARSPAGPGSPSAPGQQAAAGSRAGAEPTRIRYDDGFEFVLAWHHHPSLPEARPVIFLPG